MFEDGMEKNKIPKLNLITLIIFLLLSNIACSNEDNFNFDECINTAENKESNPITFGNDLINCYEQGHQQEDKQLNKVYKLVMATLDDKAKKSLLNEQRQWIKSRDVKALTFDGKKYKSLSQSIKINGQWGEMHYFSTLHELTKKRVEELKQILNNNSSKNNENLSQEKLLNLIAGVYKPKVTVGFYNSEIDDFEKIQSEDSYEIVPIDEIAAYIKISRVFTNGHTCEIEGIMESKTSQKFVFVDTEKIFGVCKLEMTVDEKTIIFKDPQGECKHRACGMRGFLDDKVDRDLKRKMNNIEAIKKSPEFKKSISRYKK